jgi:hypothetical protein
MADELELNIIDRIKAILKIDNNSPLELLQLLRKHRNNLHPDKFTDETAKNEAKEKFVVYSRLIDELDSYIQREKLNKSPIELALYEPLYDNSSLQSQLENIIHENEKLKDEIEMYKDKLKNMENDLIQKAANDLDKEKNELIKLYKLKKMRIFSVSLFLILTGIIPVLTKIDSIAEIIRRYAPFTVIQINSFTFFIFVFIIVLSIINWFQYYLLKIKLSEIQSPIFINKFINSLEENKYFTENDVYVFIYGKSVFFKKCLHFIGIRYYIAETTIQLKDVFIHNLLNKQLIEISYAENLDRKFKIKDKPKYYYE